MDSRKPLGAGEDSEVVRSRMVCCDNDCEHLKIEEHGYTWFCEKYGNVSLDRTVGGYEEVEYEAFRCSACLLSTLSLLTPPPDAEVKEAVEFSVEARCSRLARGILRISKKLRVMRADMASQTAALIAAMHAINDAGLLMPDEVLDYTSGVRAAQAPRLTERKIEALRYAAECLYGLSAGDDLRREWPEAFAGEVGRG